MEVEARREQRAGTAEFLQATYISARLTGEARAFVDSWPHQVWMQETFMNGVVAPPTTYLLRRLVDRRGWLGEEERLQTVSDIARFRRLPAESIADMRDRLSDLRPRAQHRWIAVNHELLSFIMLRAAGIADFQLMQLLRPHGFAHPSDARQSCHLMRALRHLEERPERVPTIGGHGRRRRATPGQSRTDGSPRRC